jgi:5'-3' exonuclease, N-terminal resolvase-like domain
MTFILVDTSNLFYRARHSVQGNADLKLGMALHITFNSVKKAWQDFDGTHVVFCLEGRSWRKDFYEPYKRNRAETRAAMTVREQEEDKLFWEAYGDFTTFLNEKTNCTVLQHPRLEADDLIAGFIQSHPTDKHVIISTDTDFHQLISESISQYNGVADQHVTHTGYYDAKGRPVIDKKTGEHKKPFDPEWMLFEKCIRGDTSDNVFSAYPGARTKGTSKKIGLTEAFEDRNTKGYAWNNFLLQKWTDHNGAEHRVLDDYDRNRILIDLTKQPDDVRAIINETISNNSKPKCITQVGSRMIKFCQSYDMKRMIDNIQSFAEPFQANYPTT